MECTTFPASYETLQHCIIEPSPQMLTQAASHLAAIGMAFNLIHESHDPIVKLAEIEKFLTKHTKNAQLQVFLGGSHDPITLLSSELATHLNKQML